MKLKTKFQDGYFELGEIVTVFIATMPDGRIKAQAESKSGEIHTYFYDELVTFYNDWEDYKGPEVIYVIDPTRINCVNDVYKDDEPDWYEQALELGLGFTNKKEALEVVEKLKAWHKLMDYWETEVLGWEIRDMPTGGNWQTVNVKFNVKTRKEPLELLDICFGGEE